MFESRRPSTRPRAAAPADADLDLGSVGRALWRKKLRILLPALLAAAVTFVAVDMMVPRYKSETRILIEGRENVFLRPEAERGADRDRGTVDQEAVNSQVQLVLSRDVARLVVERLKLKEKAEFDPVLAGVGPVRQLLMLIGLGRDPLQTRPEERIFQSYYDRLTVYQVDRSRVIAIEFTSLDPELAAQAANAVATAYLEVAQDARQEQTRAAGQWLLREIETLRTRVADAESKVEEFRSGSNLFVGPGNASLSHQQLGDASSQIGVARTQQADADAKAQAIREMLRSGQPIETNEIINSELIRRLNEQRVTLRAQLAEQSSTLLDGHPRIKELRAQIADLERQIRLEAERLVRSLENDARIAGARVAQLTRGLDQLKKQATSSNEQDVQLRAFEREAKAQRDLLESYLAKYREATARENLGATGADARVISRAIVSNTPYFPRKVPMVAIAFLGMLMLGVAFVTTGELLAVRPHRSQLADEDAGDAMVADEGLDRTGRHDFLAHADPGRMAGALRAMAAKGAEDEDHSLAATLAVLREMPGRRGRAVIVGLLHDARTAAAASTLARALAETDKTVVVHLAQDPELAGEGLGFNDLLARRASFSQVIQRDGTSRAHAIGVGRNAPDLAGLLRARRFAITAEALERAYGYVLLNAGPAPDVDNEQLARLAPVTVLVADPALATAAEAARQSLLQSGCPKVLILTDLGGAEPMQSAAAA